jgi:hypothetical protein
MNDDAARSQLISICTAYLNGLVARDFGSVPIAPAVRHTENTVELALGRGVGGTIQALHEGGHFFVDTTTGQVEFWGAAVENGRDIILGVRLKVEDGDITEIETQSVRGEGEYCQPHAVRIGTPGFHDVIAEKERSSREQLIAIANLYFDGIERSDGSLVPARPDALRLVNGAQDAGTDVSAMAESEAHRGLTVQDQITQGFYSYIEKLRDRRFLIVDEARGLVLAHVFFDHPANLVRADGLIPFPAPNSVLAFEVFKVRSGQIETVWAIGGTFPYGIRAGW